MPVPVRVEEERGRQITDARREEKRSEKTKSSDREGERSHLSQLESRFPF